MHASPLCAPPASREGSIILTHPGLSMMASTGPVLLVLISDQKENQHPFNSNRGSLDHKSQIGGCFYLLWTITYLIPQGATLSSHSLSSGVASTFVHVQIKTFKLMVSTKQHLVSLIGFQQMITQSSHYQQSLLNGNLTKLSLAGKTERPTRHFSSYKPNPESVSKIRDQCLTVLQKN